MLQQHQRRQPHDFRFRLEQPQQQAGQPDRLVAQGAARVVGRAGAGRITLVEDQVDHRGHRRQPLGPFHRPRRLEGEPGPGDPGLGPGDPLFHRGLADQESAGDLAHRQAGDDTQRQRDLLGGRQVGMAADEQEPQDVVAVMRSVEAFGGIVLGIAEVGDQFLVGQGGMPGAPPRLVDAGIAPDQDQPGGGIARRAVLRPGFQCAQTGVLERFLGHVEVAEIAQQGADGLGAGRGQRRLDPGQLAHAGRFPGWKTDSGRIS